MGASAASQCLNYRVNGVIREGSRNNGGYSAEVDLLYYDDDGNGTFERLEEGEYLQPWFPTIPTWALPTTK
jgi:hypothetical protein